ncbi:BA14K family protein [Microvirga terricola]|uniref:Lectin-like protein BA14k n=1 Tax=Microvirga terricola TaxID=2719797 RepID=A0ABX0VCK0_9HYPH|nr:BA14K family protein [Microvirga terricola]NIX75567.1 BA14K family protein [Microvirga terricola]
MRPFIIAALAAAVLTPAAFSSAKASPTTFKQLIRQDRLATDYAAYRRPVARGGYAYRGYRGGVAYRRGAYGGRYATVGRPAYRGGYYHYGRTYPYGAAAAGLAAGALVGGAVASQPVVTGSVVPAGANYCAQRYKSYNPATGTYTGYDGLQHPCP